MYLYTHIACYDATGEVFLVIANTRTKSIQKQITSMDVDKVGSKKPLASKSVSPISKALCLSYKTAIKSKNDHTYKIAYLKCTLNLNSKSKNEAFSLNISREN